MHVIKLFLQIIDLLLKSALPVYLLVIGFLGVCCLGADITHLDVLVDHFFEEIDTLLLRVLLKDAVPVLG